MPLSLKALLVSVFLILVSTLALGGRAHASGGTFTATSTAPGSDGTCEVEVTTSGAGALTSRLSPSVASFKRRAPTTPSSTTGLRRPRSTGCPATSRPKALRSTSPAPLPAGRAATPGR